MESREPKSPESLARQVMRQRGLARHLLGLVMVTHPLPSALYVVMTALLAWLAAATVHTRPEAGPLAGALLTVAGAQVAIGSLNDYCDRALDAAGNRQEKPLVNGSVAPWEALALGVTGSVVVLLTLLALTPLGALPFVLGVLIEGLGLAYDFRFKGTPVSALLFAVYFPLFPLFAWSIFGHWQPFLPWLLPFGAALGIAMNIANSLPDLEGDLAAGVRGLPHLLGLRWGLALTWALPLLVLAGMWLLALLGIVPGHGAGMLIATIGGVVSVALAMALYRWRPQPATLRLTFVVQALGVLALAGGWIAAVAF